MGLFVKSIEAAQWIGFVLIFPLTFASSAFADPSQMPTALRVFAENQPVTHVVNATRQWLVGYPASDDTGVLAFIWTIGIIVGSIPVAVWIFNNRGKS